MSEPRHVQQWQLLKELYYLVFDYFIQFLYISYLLNRTGK